MIAAHLDYPTEGQTADFDLALQRIERTDAAALLAWLSRESLAYGSRTAPNSDLVREVFEVLALLGPDAGFWTNGDWAKGWSLAALGWNPLSDATFDTGVIGCGGDRAFIFWVEEED